MLGVPGRWFVVMLEFPLGVGFQRLRAGFWCAVVFSRVLVPRGFFVPRTSSCLLWRVPEGLG